jgi:hypothetical protein
MAVKVFEGFDHYNSNADAGARQGYMQWNRSDGFSSFGVGRSGYGKCVLCNSNPIQATIVTPLVTFYLGMAVIMSSSTSSASPAVQILDQVAVGTQYSVNFNCGNGQITVSRGSTVLGTSPLNSFVATAWMYLEIGGTMSATVGTITVRVNGVTVPNLTLTGLNNITTSNASMSGFAFVSATGSGYLDDLYLCDSTSGAGTYPCNTFLGDVRVATQFPTGNNAVAWTPLAGTNWQEVSETAMDSDTSYNRTVTAGQTDTFNMAALTGTVSQVLAVQITGAYRKDDSSSHTLQQVMVSGTTTVNGATIVVPSAYVYITDLWATDPNTSASWVTANVNALKLGYNAVT